MNRAHEPGEAENDRWALAEHLRVGADHAAHVVQCASFTSLPLQEFTAVISQLDTVIISGDKNAAQSDRMFPQDNIAEVWNHHAGPQDPEHRLISRHEAHKDAVSQTEEEEGAQRMRGGGLKRDWPPVKNWNQLCFCVFVMWCERRPVVF